MQFEELVTRHRGAATFPEIRIIGIDPGQTTGVCVFEGRALGGYAQLSTKEMPLAAATTEQYIRYNTPNLIVMEAYRIYNWKTRSHANSDVHTLRLIGAIQYIAYIKNIPVVFQGAGEGKAFCTDEKLKEWSMYQVAHRHANDAIRHVAHYLLFGDTK